jgi:hypothetical protein
VMLFFYILAGLLSLASTILACHFGWSPATHALLLIGIALWCDWQLFWCEIAYLRRSWMAFDYAPRRRQCPTIPTAWIRAGYGEALISAALAGLFGAALGASVAWLVGGVSSIPRLTILLGLTYATPMFVIVPFLAHRIAEARRFVAERTDGPP